MLRSKRKAPVKRKNNQKNQKENFKQKTLEEKMKLNRKGREDEEIVSGSEDEKEKENFFEDEDQEIKVKKKSLVTADEARLKMAKKLINKIGDDVRKEGELENEADIDQYIMNEIQKDKNDHFLELSSNSNFNPVVGDFKKGHISSITAVDISSDSKFAISVSKDCRAIKWDLSTGKKYLLPHFTQKPLYACTFTPDNKYALFGGADKYIHQMDLTTEKIVQSFKAHNDAVTGIIFDQNKDQYYSCSRDNTLKVWAVGTTQKSILIETFYGHINKINDIDIMSSFGDNKTSTNRILTCGSDRQINLWKVDTQSFLQFKEMENIFSYDNIKALNKDFFITSSYDGSLNLWRTNKKKPICKIPNAHNFERSVNLTHSFFSKSLEEDSRMNNLDENNSKEYSLPYPILSVATIKNSDLIFTGSSDGFLNIYRYSKGDSQKNVKEKIELIKRLNLGMKSCINAISVNKTNEFLVIAHGKDGRLGRWDCEKKSKNGITIVKLFD